MRNIRCTLTAAFATLLLLDMLSFAEAKADARTAGYDLNIPSEDLTAALQSFAIASHHKLLYRAELTAGKISRALKGHFTVQEAMETLLAGTGLSYEITSSSVVLIKDQRDDKTSDSRENSSQSNAATSSRNGGERSILLAQTNSPATPSRDPASKDDQTASPQESIDLAEIIVTGTNIRGVTSSASPVQVFTRDDIDRTGLGTLQSFFEKLPQNFSSVSENTITTVAGNITTGNATNASAINLRGLGNDSTLLLVNGHRVAAGGLNGDIADVSLIPLAAVDRVEIVTDGASAIYGSDAVGGVVNVILRKDFDGAETRARFGSVSEGASHEMQIGQTFGKTWASGSAVISYEYLDRTPLSAADREISRMAVAPTTLLPEQVRHAVFASLQQDFANGISLFSDGTFSHRAINDSVSQLGFSEQSSGDVEAYSGVFGGRLRPYDKTEVEISTAYASSRQHVDSFQNSFANALSPENSFDINTSVLSVDAKVDGSLASLRAGDLSYAVGAQWRHETLESGQYSFATASGSLFEPHRGIGAAFAEFRIPLVAGSTRQTPMLELNLADRFEHYSDFGSTNNPQLGLIWRPINDVKIRGTVGTSFKAPLLTDLNPNPDQIVVLPEFDPQGGGKSCFPFNATNTCSNAIIELGGNSGLTSEKARTWTSGFDLKPSAVPGLSVSGTYYDIYSRDRITDPSGLFPLTIALQNESVLGPSIVQRNPSAALVQQLAASPSFINPFNIGLSTIGAYVDYREQNLTSVRTTGFDLSTAYRLQIFGGEFEGGVDGTKIFKFDNKVTSDTPDAKLLNTPFNPIDLRLRARTEFRKGPISGAVFVNYTDSYEDNRGTTPVPVASWTTVDLNFGYTCGNDCWFLQHATVLAGVTNLANRAPPYLVNALGYGVNFDGTNANALGRFIYLQVSTKW